MPVDRNRRTLALGALLLSALALGGCSSSIAELPIVATPADALSRPKEAGGYLPGPKPESGPEPDLKVSSELTLDLLLGHTGITGRPW
jgi:hypothetical protein